MTDFEKFIKDKKEELKENPGAIFGMIYPYILVLIVIIGLYYISNLDDIARQNVPPVVTIEDTTQTTVDKIVEAKNVPPIDITNMKEASPELLRKGETVYQTNCASCHGETGAGGGPASVGMNPAPRNFTQKDNWKNGADLSGIYTTLQEGIEGSAMIAYDFLLPEEKFAVSHYILNNFVPNPEMPSTEDLQALDQLYNLSAGQQIPAQIPVKYAKLVVMDDYNEEINKLNSAMEKINSETDRKGSVIFKNITTDPEIALSGLLADKSWKGNKENFIKRIKENVNQIGFNRKVYKLSDEEWNEMYNYLNELL